MGVLGSQILLQSIVGQWLTGAVSPFTLESWPILVALPLALLAGLVQESARLLAIWVALRPLSSPRRAVAPWTGALAGAGIGLTETAWLLGGIPPAHFALFSLAVLERLLAVTFHIGAGALIGYGIAVRRTALAWFVAVLLHTLVDTGAALYQMHQASYLAVMATTVVVAGALYLVTLLRRRAPGGAQPDIGA